MKPEARKRKAIKDAFWLNSPFLSFIVLTKSLCRINEREIPSIVTDSPTLIANLTVPKLAVPPT